MTVMRVQEYVAFDLETTGLLPGTDRVVEIGAIRFDVEGRELDGFERLINPERPMSPTAQAVHGISDADLLGEAPARDVLPGFVAFLGHEATTTLVAHNAVFDAGFLGRELGRIGHPLPPHPVVDTLALARRRLPDLPNHRLDTLAGTLGLNPDRPHRALADCRRVKDLWLRLQGPLELAANLVSYPIFDNHRFTPPPLGWNELEDAVTLGLTVRMVYAGGTRGTAPREVTPRGFLNKGGIAYLVAHCHLDGFEKSFRLDRVNRYECVMTNG